MTANTHKKAIQPLTKEDFEAHGFVFNFKGTESICYVKKDKNKIDVSFPENITDILLFYHPDTRDVYIRYDGKRHFRSIIVRGIRIDNRNELDWLFDRIKPAMCQ